MVLCSEKGGKWDAGKEDSYVVGKTSKTFELECLNSELRKVIAPTHYVKKTDCGFNLNITSSHDITSDGS